MLEVFQYFDSISHLLTDYIFHAVQLNDITYLLTLSLQCTQIGTGLISHLNKIHFFKMMQQMFVLRFVSACSTLIGMTF